MEQTLNLLIISREYPPFFGGGIGTYTLQFARALAHHGYRPVIVTVTDDGQEQHEEPEGFPVVRLPFIRGNDWSRPDPAIASPQTQAAFETFHPVAMLAQQIALALPRLIEQYEIDAIETPDTGALMWFALNARRTGLPWDARLGRTIPLVTHLHSPTAWIQRHNLDADDSAKIAHLRTMERESSFWSDGLVCPSHDLARWAEDAWELGKDSIPVLHYPLGDLEPIALAAPHRSARPEQANGPRRILYAGRLEPRKGVDVLLMGFARAIDAGADLVLDLAGEDIDDPRTGRPFGAACLASLEPRARERVHVHGRLSPEQLDALRTESHLAAIPSPMDNFPYTCIEAMAHGMPVLAARAGGMAEMIRDDKDGALFEPGDVETCTQCLVRLGKMDRDSLVHMGRSAAARILALCNNREVVARRVKHFEGLIAKASERQSRSTKASIVLGAADNAAKQRLGEAISGSGSYGDGVDFAHGWIRNKRSGRVCAIGTPTAESLDGAPEDLGPLAVSEEALADERLKTLVPADRAETFASAALAKALVAAGYRGAVVPEVVTGRSTGQPRVSIGILGKMRRAIVGLGTGVGRGA